MIKNISDIMRAYALPISRGKKSTYDLLDGHYKNFIVELTSSVSDMNHPDFPDNFYAFIRDYALPVIQTECDIILNILSLEGSFKQYEARDSFRRLMDHMLHPKPPCTVPMIRTVQIGKDGRLGRIRPGDEPYDRSGLFHIPLNKRELISSQRYSSSGTPCLYLAASYRSRLTGSDDCNLFSCWAECGMPTTFNANIYVPNRDLTMLHFAKSEVDYLKEYKKAETEDEREDRRNAIKQYLMSYPLRAACSLTAENKKMAFIEEYIIPQLLLSWVREYTNWDGIAYKSVTALERFVDEYSVNLAIPTKDIDPNDGHCRELKKIFVTTIPEQISLCKRLKKYHHEIESVRNFALTLKNKLDRSAENLLHPYRHILSACSLFLTACSMLEDGSVLSAEIPYQIFDNLERESLLIKKSIDNAASAEEWVQENRTIKANILSPDDMTDILKEFNNLRLAFHSLAHSLLPKLSATGFFDTPGLEPLL